MDGYDATIRIAFLFLPGITALLLVDTLIVHRRWEQFEMTLYAFALGVFSYVVAQLVRSSPLGFWAQLDGDAKGTIDAWEVGYVTLIAVAIAAVISMAINRKWLRRVAAWLHISRKYGDENLFYFFLGDDEVQWVSVRLTEKDLIYHGQVDSMSSDDESRELVLRDVRVFNARKGKLLFTLDQAYLSLAHQDVIIEVQRPKE